MAAVAAFGAVNAYGGETEVCRELSKRASGAAMEILTSETDWSCFDQSDGGQLHSDRFCIWQGQSVPGGRERVVLHGALLHGLGKTDSGAHL